MTITRPESDSQQKALMDKNKQYPQERVYVEGIAIHHYNTSIFKYRQYLLVYTINVFIKKFPK